MTDILRITTMLFLSASAWLATAQDPITRFEAEDGILHGVSIATSTPGYSGSGYVTGFDSKSDYVELTLHVERGALYRLVVRYSSPSGQRTQDLFINAIGPHPVTFEITASNEWKEQEVGIYRLNGGANTIKLQSDWGYMDVDEFVLYDAEEPVYDIATSLVDAEANEDVVALYDFMRFHFGERVMSGQTNDGYDDVVDLTGVHPMIRTYDLAEYTEGYPYAWDNSIGGHAFGAVDNGLVEKAIAWHQETGGNGIVNWQWHWCSPSGGRPGVNTFYTENTSFDVREAVKAGTDEYALVIRDIDAVAVQLQKMSDAGVPILWRPLHEAGGAWFWWGAHGAGPCLALWDIIYDRLTNHHGLHNLIWVWSTPEEDWYPGNETVDIIGYDSYPGGFNYVSRTQMYDQLYRITEGKKMIAMTENGPIPDISTTFRHHAPWSMFMSWSDLVFEQNSDEHIQAMYAHWRVLTLDEEYNVLVREEVEEVEEPEEPVLDIRQESGALQLYPNPARDRVRVLGGRFVDLAVYDMTGRSVGEWPQQADTVDVSGLSDGHYMMVFQNGEIVERLQLIIRH
ncbi:hypothetical protein BFP72_12930 [Reichenbachiella sp. 5M10]|uniref:glycosyl hydrolase n=1 Tax=Reichenbachiella sp. 5M10 TaxID=1889772 RepID=UPI000C14C4D8|nr:glycosyl hydrolase [Reichenbachiella sp. 5M10]PIB36229.1 hypothetical protein BFP72_12930 [Reichenbachiella sp. 5M10]